jgi:hypothetical protein
MVDVRMGKNHYIDGCRIEVGKAAIDFVSVLAMALVKPAIEEDTLAVDFQQVLGARGCSRRSAKLEFHVK